VRQTGKGAGWGSVACGVASCVTLPVAIYATRFSDSYDLLHSGFAIPVAVGLGLVALALARRADARSRLTLVEGESGGVSTAGRVLGVIGLCLAVSAVVALGVFGLLEYVGSRD
jgi:hypothetical protein